MGTYLVNLDDDEILSGSSGLSYLVCRLTQVFDQQARKEREQRLRLEYEARELDRYKRGVKEVVGFGGAGADGPRDSLTDRLEYLEGYILARGFELADEALPWSVHLLPHIGMDVTRLSPKAYQDLVFWFDDARDLIHRLAVEKVTVSVG